MPATAPQSSLHSALSDKMMSAAIDLIAGKLRGTSRDLTRRAMIDLVRSHATDPRRRENLRAAVLKLAPKLPKCIRSAAQVERFKRKQREFDRLLLDLHLASPAEIQARNSIVGPSGAIRVLDFAHTHYATRPPDNVRT